MLYSLLQAVRIQWRSMAHHFCSTSLGTPHLPDLHDRSLLPSSIILVFVRHVPADNLYLMVELEDDYGFWRLEQVPCFEQHL